jgi:hypothetical protein
MHLILHEVAWGRNYPHLSREVEMGKERRPEGATTAGVGPRLHLHVVDSPKKNGSGEPSVN